MACKVVENMFVKLFNKKEDKTVGHFKCFTKRMDY